MIGEAIPKAIGNWLQCVPNGKVRFTCDNVYLVDAMFRTILGG